jgi:hypothetical protein
MDGSGRVSYQEKDKKGKKVLKDGVGLEEGKTLPKDQYLQIDPWTLATILNRRD